MQQDGTMLVTFMEQQDYKSWQAIKRLTHKVGLFYLLVLFVIKL